MCYLLLLLFIFIIYFWGITLLKHFLGIKVTCSVKGIFLSQRKYTLDILEVTGFLRANPRTFTMEQNLALNEQD
jgi:hypothetical protein